MEERRKQTERECPACGTHFMSSHPGRKYCDQCKNRSGKKPQGKHQGTPYTGRSVDLAGMGFLIEMGTELIQPKRCQCKICGKTFYSTGGENLCSKTCSVVFAVRKKTCAKCRKDFQRGDTIVPKNGFFYHDACLGIGKKRKEYGYMSEMDTSRVGAYDRHIGYNTRSIKKAGAVSDRTDKKRLPPLTEMEVCAVCGRQFAGEDYTCGDRCRTIFEKGLCSICRTPYKRCRAQTAAFQRYPEGVEVHKGLVYRCPRYTRKR